MTTARLQLPPIGNDDHIPNKDAVWRTGTCPAETQRAICVEYEGGIIARTYVGSVPDWSRVVRWRYGWPPR